MNSIKTIGRLFVLLAVMVCAACGHNAAGDAFVGHWVSHTASTFTYNISPDPNGTGYIVKHAEGGRPERVYGGALDGSLMHVNGVETLSIDADGHLRDSSTSVYERVN